MKKYIITITIICISVFAVNQFQKQQEQKKFGIFGHIVPKAIASSSPTAIGTLRNNIFLLIGYPSTTIYNELNPNGGGPQAGLIGMMESIFTTMASIANSNSIAECDDVPSTGSYNGSLTLLGTTADATLTFETPTKTVPTGWQNAGTTYAKRAKLVSGTNKVAVEFFCDRNAAFAILQVAGDSEEYTNSTRTLNMYYDFEEEDASNFEMAMRVADDDNECGSSNTCEVWLMRAQKRSDNAFMLWQSSFAWRGEKFQGERLILNGDSESKSMSAFYTFESDFGTTLAGVTGSDQGVSGSVDYNFSSTTTADLFKQGCIDFNDPDAALSATTVCNGYSLSAPSATIFSAGDFSYTGLKSVPNAITTL